MIITLSLSLSHFNFNFNVNLALTTRNAIITNSTTTNQIKTAETGWRGEKKGGGATDYNMIFECILCVCV